MAMGFGPHPLLQHEAKGGRTFQFSPHTQQSPKKRSRLYNSTFNPIIPLSPYILTPHTHDLITIFNNIVGTWDLNGVEG